MLDKKKKHGWDFQKCPSDLDALKILPRINRRSAHAGRQQGALEAPRQLFTAHHDKRNRLLITQRVLTCRYHTVLISRKAAPDSELAPDGFRQYVCFFKVHLSMYQCSYILCSVPLSGAEGHGTALHRVGDEVP